MIEITFEINGRQVDPRNISDALEAAVLRSIQDSLIRKVGPVRCPEHGSMPKIVCRGRSLNELSFEVSGCCQKLIDAVTAKLR